MEVLLTALLLLGLLIADKVVGVFLVPLRIGILVGAQLLVDVMLQFVVRMVVHIIIIILINLNFWQLPEYMIE